MPTVISLASGKGGVGKTTTAVNLACAWGQQGIRVLVWDLDGQGNAGQGLGVGGSRVRLSSYHLLTGKATQLAQAFHSTAFQNVTVIPAQMELFTAEQELGGAAGREYIVRDLLTKPEAHAFDVVLLDLPPNLGFSTDNGFAASRWVLVPLRMSRFSLSGLRQLAHAIHLAQEKLNPELELLGLIPTFVSDRTAYSGDLLKAIGLVPNTRVFQPYIPNTVRVAEGAITGVPVVAAAPDSLAARAYAGAATAVWEVIRKSPAHVQRAPSPTIPEPARAASAVTPDDLRAEILASPEPPRRRSIRQIFHRPERSSS